jgi:hypothetical protein
MRQSYEVAVTHEVTFKTVSIPLDVNGDFVSVFQLHGFKIKGGRRLKTYVNVPKMRLYVWFLRLGIRNEQVGFFGQAMSQHRLSEEFGCDIIVDWAEKIT